MLFVIVHYVTILALIIRDTLMKIIKAIFLPIVFLLLTGCSAVFVENSVPKPEPLSIAQYEQKPNVFFKVRSIHGTPSYVRTARPMWDNYVKNQVAYAANKNQLFNYWTFNEDEINTVGSVFDRPDEKSEIKIDYRIEVAYFHEIDYDEKGWALVWTGLTLGLLPTHYNQYTTIELRVYDNKEKLLYSGQNSTSSKTWNGIWFIPIGFFYDYDDVSKQEYYQIETLFLDAVRKNVFKYK